MTYFIVAVVCFSLPLIYFYISKNRNKDKNKELLLEDLIFKLSLAGYDFVTLDKEFEKHIIYAVFKFNNCEVYPNAKQMYYIQVEFSSVSHKYVVCPFVYESVRIKTIDFTTPLLDYSGLEQ